MQTNPAVEQNKNMFWSFFCLRLWKIIVHWVAV